MKTIIKFSLTLLILFAFSCSQETTLDPVPADLNTESLKVVSAKATSKETVAIVSPVPGADITGTSTLHRNKNGITVNFKAENLNPGAYTIWWVIWNNPVPCGDPDDDSDPCTEADFAKADLVEVDIMYAGGHVVGNNGKGNFSAHLNAGDETPESIIGGFGLPDVIGGGLQVGKTFSSEVHVVIRTHGPAVPGMVNDQISSYGGGCTTEYPAFSAYPDIEGHCADFAAAIFPPVD